MRLQCSDTVWDSRFATAKSGVPSPFRSATARLAGDTAVVRVLSDCYAEMALSGARGFSDGNASACIRNRNGPAREVIIAVGRYSGSLDNDSFAFDRERQRVSLGI